MRSIGLRICEDKVYYRYAKEEKLVIMNEYEIQLKPKGRLVILYKWNYHILDLDGYNYFINVMLENFK